MYTRSPRIVVFIFAAAVLAGCACPATRSGYPAHTEYIVTGRPINAALVRGIQKKETTHTEITEWFGAPTHRVATEDAIAYTYRHCKTKIPAIDIQSIKETCTELFIVFDRPSLTVKNFAYAPKSSEGHLTNLSRSEPGISP